MAITEIRTLDPVPASIVFFSLHNIKLLQVLWTMNIYVSEISRGWITVNFFDSDIIYALLLRDLCVPLLIVLALFQINHGIVYFFL